VAFHKRILPRIEKNLNVLLGRVTGGAHDEAALWINDQTGGNAINFSVTDSIKGAPVAPERLSQGTSEQLYLCARIALVEALTHDESAPVMLDDPFINYDGDRLSAAVKVLAETAGGRQLFLFTCQDDVKELAAEAGATIIELVP
jgi:uncharacterized protein YhaN